MHVLLLVEVKFPLTQYFMPKQNSADIWIYSMKSQDFRGLDALKLIIK
jgi:hypothetical protein